MQQPAVAVLLPQRSLVSHLLCDVGCLGLQSCIRPATQAAAAAMVWMMAIWNQVLIFAADKGGGETGRGSARVQAEAMSQA